MSKPRYALIADDIRAKVRRGELGPGDQLPTNAQLMEQWSAALNTVARAIQELRNEGLVETFHGVGSFIRDQTPKADAEAGDQPDLLARVERLEEMCGRLEQLETLMMEVFSNLGLAYPNAPKAHGAREAM